MIRAEVHSDDFVVKSDFDATKWFEAATDQQILELAKCDWGGDYPADEVAQWSTTLFPENQAVFDYVVNLPDSDYSGFECHIDPEDALNWIKQHRPHLSVKIPE